MNRSQLSDPVSSSNLTLSERPFFRAQLTMPTEYLFFYGHKPKSDDRHVFSNWCPAKFVDPSTGFEYHNVEQYMMARKALLFEDHETHAQILDTPDPSQVKALGRRVRNFRAEVWGRKCYNAVLDGCRLKFTQNPRMQRTLLKTAPLMLVEAAPNDAIWGIGLNAETARNTDPSQWPGTNLLGRLLTQLREELVQKTTEGITVEHGQGSSKDLATAAQPPAGSKPRSKRRLQ